MTAELKWLTLTALMTALFWVPYILDRIATRGLVATLGGGVPDNTAQSAWAQRAIKAHGNAVENLVVFATVVLVAHALGISTPLTVAAAAAYFFARLAHFLVYVFAIPLARTLAFTVGWLAQIAFIAAIFRWV